MSPEEQTVQTAPDASEGTDRSPASGNGLPYVGGLIPKASDVPPQSQSFNPQGAPGNLPNYQQDWVSGRAGPGVSPKPSKWDKVMSGLSQGVHDSFLFGTLPRMYQEKSGETGTQLSADQANKLNPYRPTPYTTPVDSGIVAMEAEDGRKQQQVQEWLGRNDLSGAGVGRFVGGFTDIPLYAAIGALTGGLGDLAVGGGEAMLGRAGGVAARYGWTLGEFSMVGEEQNKLEASMGAKRKTFTEVVQDSMGGAALATGLGYLGRRFLNRGETDPAALERGVKENAAAIANDEKLPQLEEQRRVLEDRRGGVTQSDPGGDRILPTVKTLPTSDTPFYAATHSDGTPLVHEHGLGQGVQLTDSYDVANNGVSKSSSMPGQIAETRIPGGTKLLDLDRSAAEDYASKDSLLKAVEEKTGVPLDAAVKNGESLKDVITNLGDWAGVEIAGGKTIPEDILKQIQDVVKERGYHGYSFEGENSHQVHLFDPKELGLQPTSITHADPSRTPDLPGAGSSSPESAQPPATPEAQEAQERLKNQNYSPSAVSALEQIRKTAKTLHPDDIKAAMAETEQTLQEHKQQLMELAKKFDEENNPKIERQTVYHGTNTNFDKFDFERGGGMVHFAEKLNDAERYAEATGSGGRASLGPADVLFKDDHGGNNSTDYRWDGENFVSADGKKFSLKEANAERENGTGTFEPVNKRVISQEIDPSKILDISTDAGKKKFLDILKPENSVEKRFIASLKAEMADKYGDSGAEGINRTFWTTTKSARGDQINAGLQALSNRLADEGFHGVRFLDDSHPSIALLRGAFDESSAPVENPIKEQLKELREQEAHDKRMLDVAKRIVECGATE